MPFPISCSIERAALTLPFSERKATIYKHVVRSIVSQTIKSLIADSSPLGKFVAKCHSNSSATFGSKILAFSQI